ncbi:MAG: hypothetical protein HC866_03745 [Leptolyngbyaceae cyanobacterium RU_5_1]|nr:hypothetical protein [Leptolyngbyaceae cyanobacterium RU_5_1]
MRAIQCFLKAYVLAHREDEEAFYVLADRILANPNAKWYSPEDANRFPEIYAEYQKRRQEESES